VTVLGILTLDGRAIKSYKGIRPIVQNWIKVDQQRWMEAWTNTGRNDRYCR